MRLSYLAAALLMLLLCANIAAAQAMPRMTTVEPDTVKVGEVLAVAGENLGKAHVAEVFLTDGKNDVKVAVSEQAEKGIKFKIPAAAKAGRFSLMILTAGKDPKLIEQPVRVTIEK